MPVSAHNPKRVLYIGGGVGDLCEWREVPLLPQPYMGEVYFNRGVAAMMERGDKEAALAWLEMAILASPDFVQAYEGKAFMLFALCRLDEALQAYNALIALSPGNPVHLCNKGVIFGMQRRFPEALACYKEAISIAPQRAYRAHMARAQARLIQGDFGGFGDWYCSCWREWALPNPWTGQNPQGKTILVHEGGDGYGDTFQFCRYIERLRALGAQVIVQVRPDIVNLLKTLKGVTTIIANSDARPTYDYHVACCPLMANLVTDVATIYAPVAYLRSDPTLQLNWRSRLGKKRRPRIGLAWWTSTSAPGAGARNIDLADLVPHLPPDFDYFSLQHSLRDTDRESLAASHITHFGEEMTFDQTAALMDCCDLVIAIDSSLAHLAGALGRPLWVVLRFNADWRWFLDRDDSPWYPTARLYRQQAIGEWREPLEQIGRDLVNTFPVMSKARPPVSFSEVN